MSDAHPPPASPPPPASRRHPAREGGAELQAVRRLQSATAALSSAASEAEVAEALIGEGGDLLGASGGALLVLEEAGEALRLAWAVGVPEDRLEAWRSFPVAGPPTPSRDVLRWGEPLFLDGRRACLERYPHLADEFLASEAEALVCLPLVTGERSLGTLLLRFPSAREFPDEARSLLSTLARIGAHALERVRLVRETEEARRHADASSERLRAQVAETERATRALRESEDQFRTLADTIPQLAWMADATGWIFWYNRRWYEYTGTTLRQMEGWGWQAVHHADHVERVSEGYRAGIEAGESWEDTFPLRSASGEYRWFLSRALPIRDPAGRVVRWFGTNTDVTEQRRVAEERAELLERERAARREAEAANRAKAQFLGVMSHELRTPLNAVLGYADLLLTGTEGDLNAGQRRQVERIRVSARAQLGLIEEILTFARVEAGREEVRPEPADVSAILHEVAEILRPQAQRKGLDLAVDAPPELPAVTDASKLRQIVLNLAGNAAKFTAEGGVRLEARAEGDTLVVRVCDTGPGVPEAQAEAIFEPFTQLHPSSTRPDGGTGLGLAISRRLAALLGGTLDLDPAAARGACFVLRVPRTLTGSEAPAP